MKKVSIKLFHLFFIVLILFYSCDNFEEEKADYEIAYSARENDVLCIYKMDLNSLKPERMTEFGNDCLSPKYSPDGEYIVYHSGGDLYQIDSDGKIVNLTKSPYFEFYHSISKDGDMIIYLSDKDEINNDHRSEVYSLNINTYEETRLTYSESWAYKPGISPSGTMFSYLSWDSTEKYYDLILQEFGNSEFDTICNHSSSFNFSPDGKIICYSVIEEGLYLTDIYTKETRLLTDEGFNPVFSPDGSKVYYQKGINDELVLACINIDGTGKKHYDTGSTIPEQFNISSDGKLIAFVKSDDDGSSYIYTIGSGGKNMKKITPGYTPVFKP